MWVLGGGLVGRSEEVVSVEKLGGGLLCDNFSKLL